MDSALSLAPAKSRKSPLRAFLRNGLLLGLFIGSGVAQTRLDTSQIAPLDGEVRGPFTGNTLRDVNSAADHGNRTSNAIASAIADCGVTVSCSIIVPPSYGVAESVPGYQLNFNSAPLAATTPGNISIFDRRNSDARMSVNNLGYPAGLINAPSGWVYNYYSKQTQNANLAAFYIRQWSLAGGNSQKSAALNYADKTTWATALSNEISHTPAQHLNLGLGGQAFAPGNYTAINNLVNCSGGYTTEGDLGCHVMDNIVAQGTVEYAGTLSGSPISGATSLTVSPTQGANMQGTGRFLVDTGGTISTGTISQVNSAAATTVTGSGTSWPVSAVVALLGTDVSAPGVAVVTPSTFSIGAISGLNTSSLVCVSDSVSFEMLRPSTLTATTFTANFAKPHPRTATISAGGLCGYLLDLTADDVTNATMPNKSQTITGTLHFAWPVISSSSTTSAAIWVAGDGVFQQIASRWNPASANGYVFYPFAEVTSTMQSGGLSNNLTVGPNSVAWHSGDSVAEFLYPAGHFLFGNTIIESYYPNVSGANGFSLQYNLPLQSNEAMLSLTNNAPSSFYSSYGGALRSPRGLHISSPAKQTLAVDLPADNATIGIGCTAPCNANETILAAANASYYDFLFYDAANKHWNVSTNVNSTRYGLGANQLSVPFANVSMANDSNLNGYISATQLRSTVSTNSDSSGELVFSNASSATQALLGTYASHPECLARPQFDAGATNRFWITYAASSITVNFAAPVTGVVNYSCAARN